MKILSYHLFQQNRLFTCILMYIRFLCSHHTTEHGIGVHHWRHGWVLDGLEFGRLGDEIIRRTNSQPGAIIATLITVVRCQKSSHFSKITHFLERILMEHIDITVSLESQLRISSISSIGIPSENRDIFSLNRTKLLMQNFAFSFKF